MILGAAAAGDSPLVSLLQQTDILLEGTNRTRGGQKEQLMVLNAKQTTVAYRCPHCGSGVMSAVSPFSLRGNMVRLKCTCGESVMTVEPAGEGKVRMTVPCIICPKPHRYTVSEKMLFSEELFVLPCAYSDLNIAMMGEINCVKAELARTELQLLDLMEKNGITDFAALHREANETVTDPQVLEIVLFVIRDLDDEGKIFCRCERREGEEGQLDVELEQDGVKITCRCCGASGFVKTDSLLDAHEFLNTDSLQLK